MTHFAFRQFVLKVFSRCDLACDYCYVYEKADQSWRLQPMRMSRSTATLTAQRIADHAQRHGVESVTVTLHGGEPLLLGPDGLRELVTVIRDAVAGKVAVCFSLQTNGVRLDRPMADVLLQEGISVGVSLDGGAAEHNRHRQFADGRGSFTETHATLELLSSEPYREVFSGILCTVDVRNRPGAVLAALAPFHPPTIDLLLPHATHAELPPTYDLPPPAYGHWLAEFFDRWNVAPAGMHVRLFDAIVLGLLGGIGRSEAVGPVPSGALVVETDGSLQGNDALKVAYEGAAATAYTVFDHAIDDVLADPWIRHSVGGWDALSDACRACPVVGVCGGGLYAHRFRPPQPPWEYSVRDFENASVYCEDLRFLIEHIAHQVRPHQTVKEGTPTADRLEQPAVAMGKCSRS